MESRKDFIEIDGMVCGACSSTVQNLLDNMEGIEKASVSLMLNRAQVVYNQPLTLDDIIDEIECVGFDAKAMDVGSESGFQLEIREKDFVEIDELLRKHPAVLDASYEAATGRVTVEFAIPSGESFGPRTASEMIENAGFYVKA